MPLGQAGAARRGNGDCVYGAARLGPCGASGGSTSTERNASPGGACRDSRRQLLGRQRFGQLQFHHFVDPSIPTARAKGKRHPRFGMKPFAHASSNPARRNQPLEAPHQVAVPDQTQVSLLAKTNAYSLSNHRFELLPAAAVGGGTKL